MNKQEIIQILKSQQERYANEFGIRFIGVFGSFARDEANENSDIDILYKIEKNKKFSMFDYLKLLKNLENNFNKKVDLVRDETLKPAVKAYVYRDLAYV